MRFGGKGLAPICRRAMIQQWPELQALYGVVPADGIDAIVFLTLRSVVPPTGPQTNEEATFRKFILNITPGSNAGIPGIQLPLGPGAQSGLPVGRATAAA